MGRSVMFYSSKGGVGKTTCSLEVAHGLARLGYTTVIVDADPQGDCAAIAFEQDARPTYSLEHVLARHNLISESVGIGSPPWDRIHVMPPGLNLTASVQSLSGAIGIKALKPIVATLATCYDYVFIDAGGKSDLFNWACLYASDHVYVLTDTGARSGAAAQHTIGMLRALLEHQGWTGKLEGVIPVKVSGSNSLDHKMAMQNFKNKFDRRLLMDPIPHSYRVEAVKNGRRSPVRDVARSSEAIVTRLDHLCRQVLDATNTEAISG